MRPLAESDPREVGGYRALAELGRGGMGRVLLGVAADGRLVAVKQVHPQFTEEHGFRARFRREVDASRKVSGEYTAAVLNADADAPTPWLASVFVPGPSLQEAVDTVGSLPEESALHLAAGLAAALVEIHRAGLVHRDLKPSNVLLAADGPRVIDFGIARAADSAGGSRLTHTGWLVGTPEFMSPEQAQSGELTPASDVFSLGSVLVMACTGRGPFNGPSAPQTLYNVVHAQPDLSAMPTEVRRIAALCLAKDPASRPSPDQLLASIGRIAPATQSWPPEVHQLIAVQHAEIVRLREAAPRQDTLVQDTLVRETLVPAVPPAWPTRRPTRQHGVITGVGIAAALVASAVITAVVLTAQHGNNPSASSNTDTATTATTTTQQFTSDPVTAVGTTDTSTDTSTTTTTTTVDTPAPDPTTAPATCPDSSQALAAADAISHPLPAGTQVVPGSLSCDSGWAVATLESSVGPVRAVYDQQNGQWQAVTLGTAFCDNGPDPSLAPAPPSIRAAVGC